MVSDSGVCTLDKVVKFLEDATKRQSFQQIKEMFKKKLDENPIFQALVREGALGKNIIVILGGRGCGKTLVIRYIEHYLSGSWKLEYVNFGEQTAEKGGREGQNSMKKEGAPADFLRSTVEKIETALKNSPTARIALALDDLAEAEEEALKYIRDKLVPMVNKYAGRFMLILALQSERITAERATTLQILKVCLAEAPGAEMFFGEFPEESIESAFRNSYTRGKFVQLFRGASIVNLDAYWSRLRRLERINELAEVIASIADFYITNASGGECSSLLEEVRKYKHGLAVLTLSSLPKASLSERIIAEVHEGGSYLSYPNYSVASLNGLGIAELLLGFLRDRNIRVLAEKLSKFYEELRSQSMSQPDPEIVKDAILKAVEQVLQKHGVYRQDRGIEVYRDQSIRALGLELPYSKEAQGAVSEGRRRKRGPQIDFIHIRSDRIFLVVHALRADRRGYISSSTLNKLRELIELKVPSAAEARYLVVIVPNARSANAVSRVVPVPRIGVDVLVLTVDALSGIDSALVHKIAGEGDKLAKEYGDEFTTVLYMIVAGTVLLNLRTPQGEPTLAYYLFPQIR
ncbi:MAG: hypothetical protein B7O98_02655 [Zestosphaera tikiterensis]|uniref:Uncharacterized protein n=1 Tax=Zestosphaera tikiterensis TaxID=1973259 RepID=A0A2R7Y731_9CREN|nr:MAG: hypothetical protein B7O98_02655 [Zestosphaera tikiterensis]